MEGLYRQKRNELAAIARWRIHRFPVAKMFGVTAIPHTFTIDADGVLQEEHDGDASIEGKLKKLLAQAQDR
jgi:hypothetical protein